MKLTLLTLITLIVLAAISPPTLPLLYQNVLILFLLMAFGNLQQQGYRFAESYGVTIFLNSWELWVTL